MTPELAAASVKGPVRDLNGAWAACPTTLRRARLLELTGWAFYVAGRGGVLGDDVRPDTVAAAIGLIAPEAVRAGWEAAGKARPSEVAASRLAECARWGDEHLGGFEEIDRTVALAERVVVAADGIAMPLFVASRAVPVPDGGPGARAAILVQLLYELWAGALLIGIRACRLTAAEALVAGPEGTEEAIAFGWQPPFPARAPLMRRYVYAEALAERVAGQAYAALTAGERAELAQLIRGAAAAARVA